MCAAYIPDFLLDMQPAGMLWKCTEKHFFDQQNNYRALHLEKRPNNAQKRPNIALIDDAEYKNINNSITKFHYVSNGLQNKQIFQIRWIDKYS